MRQRVDPVDKRTVWTIEVREGRPREPWRPYSMHLDRMAVREAMAHYRRQGLDVLYRIRRYVPASSASPTQSEKP